MAELQHKATEIQDTANKVLENNIKELQCLNTQLKEQCSNLIEERCNQPMLASDTDN